MMARYKQTCSPRFTSPDPIFDTSLAAPTTWNRYGYVHGDPINAMDPSGTQVPRSFHRAPEGADEWLEYGAVPGGDPIGSAVIVLPGACTLVMGDCGPGCHEETLRCTDLVIVIPGLGPPSGGSLPTGTGGGGGGGNESGFPKQRPVTFWGYQVSIGIECEGASAAERRFWQRAIPGSAEHWDAISFAATTVGTGFSVAGDMMWIGGWSTGVGAPLGTGANAASGFIAVVTSAVSIGATDLSSLKTGEASVLRLSPGASSLNARVGAVGSAVGMVAPFVGTVSGAMGMSDYINGTGFPFYCK